MRPRHRMKVRIPGPIRSLLRQRNAENPIVPLKVQTSHMELPRQVFQIKIIMVDPPRPILMKAVNNQAVAS